MYKSEDGTQTGDQQAPMQSADMAPIFNNLNQQMQMNQLGLMGASMGMPLMNMMPMMGYGLSPMGMAPVQQPQQGQQQQPIQQAQPQRQNSNNNWMWGVGLGALAGGFHKQPINSLPFGGGKGGCHSRTSPFIEYCACYLFRYTVAFMPSRRVFTWGRVRVTS